MAPTLGMIGAGNMGWAILRGAVERGVLPAHEILVVEPDADRRRAAGGLGCAVSADPAAARGCRELMLAVKPQAFAAVAAALGVLHRRMVVTSIMAGLHSRRIRAALGAQAAVVRVMPNTPCQIGLGMSAVALGAGARGGDDALARRLFGTIGEVREVAEDDMHAVTAVSGSGPAYVFLLAEAMERAAVDLGLDAATARQLVAQTIRGAGELAHRLERPPSELRVAVTSPGGTTAAALDVFAARGFESIVGEALRAARDRGQALDQ
jgi:pyrroline-5-carboxylate reductase